MGDSLLSITLAVLAGAMYSFNGIFVKCFTKRFSGNENDSSSLYSILLGIIIALVSFGVNGFNFKFSPLTLLLAVINCVGLLIHNTFIVKAMSCGPYSLISIFCMSGGIIMPLVVTMLAFFEVPTLIQLIGIAVTFIAFGIMLLGKSDTGVTDKKKYIIYLIILFLANGLCAVGYSLEKRLEGGAYKQEMIIMEYVILVAVAFVMLIMRRGSNTLSVFRQSGSFYLFVILACLVLAAGNNLQVFSITAVSEAVAFTAKNGSSIVLSALLSLIIFKEKIDLKKWIAISVCIVSIVLFTI